MSANPLHNQLCASKAAVQTYFDDESPCPEGFMPYHGICVNLRQLSEDAIDWDLFDSLVVQWPLYSGHRLYPVPCADDYPENEYETASEASTMWDDSTEYGRNRRALLDFLIEATA